MRLRASSIAALGSVLFSAAAGAAPIVGPPAGSGVEQTLADLAASYQRQQDVFSSAENGLSLDTIVKAPDVDLVKKFFAQTAQPDFTTFAGGRTPFDVVDHFDEYGDEGNFAGTASLGVAARLIVLRQSGADAAEIARARDAAVRAARAWHVYGAIGGPGVVARGVRKVSPAASSPGPVPDLVPLKDGSGNPLPQKKQPTWRAPVAPGFDGWIWFDDTSKDQVIGYALAVSWLWDALHDDPMAPKEVSDALAADLTAFARVLMKTAPEYDIDLCIRDADGRLTSFHDLNDRQLTPEGVAPEDAILLNGFNAALALAVIRAAYHVSGDPEIGRYYYEELVGRRDYPGEMAKSSGLLFVGPATNYSNVNMLAIALATLGRIETDAYVREQYDKTLQTQFWSHGDDRDVSHVHQAWFDAIYASYATTPVSGVPERIAADLAGFQGAPAFERDRVNCDDGEIAAGSCLAIDGKTTIVLAKGKGHGGGPVAQDPLPRSIRPDSDFDWRSDPHSVNGSASTLLDPGGDYLAAYWLARASDRDSSKNRSPFARAALPYTRGMPDDDAGTTNDAAPAASSSSGGCGCALPAHASASPFGIALALTACAGTLRARARRRR